MVLLAAKADNEDANLHTDFDIYGWFPMGTKFSPPEKSTKHLTETPSSNKIEY